MTTHHRSAIAPRALPIIARRGTQKKYIKKRTDTLTPWLDEALPGHSRGNILNEHLHNLPLLTHYPHQ
jgi:hypothetical protein